MTDSIFPSKKYLRFIAEAGFFILFPGFFFYHLCVAVKLITPFAAGLFGPTTVLLCVLFSMVFVSIFRTFLYSNKYVSVLFAVLLTFVVSWTFVHYFFGTGIESGEGPLNQSLTTLFSWVALFLVGVYLPIRQDRLRIILTCCFIAMFIIAICLFDKNTMMLNVRTQFIAEDKIATYQGFARSALIVAVYLLITYESIYVRSMLIASSIILIFLLGGRSEFYGFIALFIAFAVILVLKSWRYILSSILLLFVLGLGLAGFIDDLHLHRQLNPSRQMQVLDLDKASSWVGRKKLQRIAIDQVMENPITGKYAGNFYAGRPGGYAHNVLSAWVSFGFIGFCIYLGLIIYCFAVSLFSVKNRDGNANEWGLALAINFLSLLLVLTAKSVFWPIPALGWGLTVNATLKGEAKNKNNII